MERVIKGQKYSLFSGREGKGIHYALRVIMHLSKEIKVLYLLHILILCPELMSGLFFD